jgi:hypothetical protein
MLTTAWLTTARWPLSHLLQQLMQTQLVTLIRFLGSDDPLVGMRLLVRLTMHLR